MSSLKDFLLAPPEPSRRREPSPSDRPDGERADARPGHTRCEDRHDRPPKHADARHGAAPTVALLAPRSELAPLAAGIALALASRSRASAGLVCIRAQHDDVLPAARLPAVPGARRLAAGLADAGHPVAASGRLVTVELAGDELEAAESWRRAVAPADGIPAVLALALREHAFEALLAAQDAVFATFPADAPDGLAGLVTQGLSQIAPAVPVEAPRGRAWRALAAAGLAWPRALRAALEDVQL